MCRLFCPGLHVGSVNLAAEEAHHAITVLRAKVGQEVVLFSGSGVEATGVITRIGRKELDLDVPRLEQRPFELSRRITLAVAMPRTHRQGQLIEKCTELGVAAIWPIITERSTSRPKATSVEKWSRRAVEAAKQAGRSWVPAYAEPQAFDRSLERIRDFVSASLTHVDPPLCAFSRFLAATPVDSSILVWVGPEGGWSDAQIGRAVDAGAVLTSLGPTVLRTETAAIAVCAAAAMLGAGATSQRST